MKHLTQMTFAVMRKGWKMSRYIASDAIVDKVCEGISCNECSFGTNEDGMSECVLQKRIDELPTADVVEVVRCADCIHGTKDFDKFLCEWNQEFHDGDWFCADGERREDDTQN